MWRVIVYFLLLGLYAVFSYSLTDPNLVLTSWAPYWQFQQWMWRTFFNNRDLLVTVYFILLSALWVQFFLLYQWLKEKKNDFSHKNFLLLLSLFIVPLFFSYNALSHDVFNYIFNAKMVVEYNANPHVHTALEYSDDTWVRFMHNTHTPAPYGYSWTALSLIPYWLGGEIFSLTWLLFRVCAVLSVFLLFLVVKKGYLILFQKDIPVHLLAAIFFQPLFLLEIIGNMHNDLWMMVPALGSILCLLLVPKTNYKKSLYLGSILLFVFSIFVKFATVLLIPQYIITFVLVSNFEVILKKFPRLLRIRKIIGNFIDGKVKNFLAPKLAFLATTSLLLLLLTPRSRQFLPWYLIWALVFFPFIKSAWLRAALLVLSLSSSFRYIPWMWEDGYTDMVLFQEKVITWTPLVLFLLFTLWRKKRNKTETFYS